MKKILSTIALSMIFSSDAMKIDRDELKRQAEALRSRIMRLDPNAAVFDGSYLNSREVRYFCYRIPGEIYSASRAPTPHEEHAVLSIMGLLDSCGTPVHEVRIMDAGSLVRAMQISDYEKASILYLLDASPGEACSFIQQFLLITSKFQDGYTKNRVVDAIVHGCEKSKIYRDAFITLIARLVAEPSISTHYIAAFAAVAGQTNRLTGPLSFLRGQSKSNYNAIHIANLAKTHRSLFGPIGNVFYDFLVLFHEAGHSISADFVDAASAFGLCENIFLISSNFMHIDVYPHGLNQLIQRIKNNSLFRQQILQILKKYFPETNADGLELKLSDIALSRYMQEVLLLHKEGEIFQIKGLFAVKHGGRKILYVNSLSDFALYSQMGLPIRSDHLSAYDFISQILSQIFIFSMNFEFHGAMLAVHGDSMESYWLRLVYGGGKLARHLRREQRLSAQMPLPLVLDWLSALGMYHPEFPVLSMPMLTYEPTS
ncbi:MAG: hypothetical protein LBF54_04715 [Holosporaceae bacterium]|jgi:hypothetical protein|nr:hypothetical protein [Holosporaceae bacterium]